MIRPCRRLAYRGVVHGSVLLVFVSQALAQSSPPENREIARVRGAVVDTAGQPVSSAYVFDRESGIATQTDSAGRFWLLDVPTGRRQLVVRRLGFLAGAFEINLAAGETLPVVVELTALPSLVDSVRVVAHSAPVNYLDRVGFNERSRDRRRGAGSATFIGPADIARRRPQRTSDLLSQVAGIRLRQERGVAVPYGRDGRCVMNVWIDGALIEGLYEASSAHAFSASGGTQRSGASSLGGIDGFILASDVQAVEVYQSPAEVPPRFDAINNQCGAIVIWTR